MMTIATKDQRTAPGEPVTEAEASFTSAQLVDMGLLVTLNSRMHCRTPMQLVDPEVLPIHQPVYVDGAKIVPAFAGSPLESVATYRCACGFTIDAPAMTDSPAVTLHALAS